MSAPVTPSQPYRNDADALRERKTTLERELETLRAEAANFEGIRARQTTLERELGEIAARLGSSAAKRGLPLLDQVRVASPCSAKWDDMIGDAAVRFCTSCEKNVYNLSAMPREQAEGLLAAREGSELCIRIHQRADGTVMTADCPVGVRRKRRKKAALAVAGAGAMAFAAMTAMTRSRCTTMGSAAMMGEVGPVAATDPIPTEMKAHAVDSPPPAVTVGTPAVPIGATIGSASVPPPPPPVYPHVVGRRAPPRSPVTR